MLFSAIIPVYNTPVERLVRCLNSIYLQNPIELEVILVDDGSQQEFSAQYQLVCNRYKDIYYYRKENGGPATARNYGVEKARGKYISFMDADDYISDYYFQQAESIINKYHPDLIIGLVKRCKGTNDHAIESMRSDQLNTQIYTAERDRMKLVGQMLSHANKSLIYPNGYIGTGPVAKIFRREMFLYHKFDEKLLWNEDVVWNIQLIKACNTIVVCKETWYAYSIYEQSVTQGYRENCVNEFLLITKTELDIISQLWPVQLFDFEGIYMQIWSDMFILCRTFLFHPQNNMTYQEKYSLLKKAIESEPYQIAIKNLRFENTQGKMKRLIKKFLRFTMCRRWYSISYFILKHSSNFLNKKTKKLV